MDLSLWISRWLLDVARCRLLVVLCLYVQTAILAAGSPDKAAFMADEPTVAILGQGSLKYNLNEYMEYSKGINHVCEELNSKESGRVLSICNYVT